MLPGLSSSSNSLRRNPTPKIQEAVYHVPKSLAMEAFCEANLG